MKRPLNNEELELTNKGLERVNKQKEEYSKALDTITYHRDFLVKKREYDDYMRPINREKEDKEINGTIEGYTSELKMCDEKIEVMNEQIKNGVEKKEVIGTG